jgi:hypothetical protein
MRVALLPLLMVSLFAAASPPEPPRGVPLTLPGVTGGIGFDDLQLSRASGLVLVPGGRSGKLFLVDPKTRAVSEVAGFSPTGGKFEGGHGEGITSVAEGAGRLYVTDRTSLSLLVVDAATKSIVGRTKLAASPDYVRFVAPRGEIWVTEPDKDQIEVFTASDPSAAPVHAALIPVPGGPESLVVDAARDRAYSHLWKGKTVALDVAGRRIAETWDNRCEGSRGIALDEAKHFVFAACSDGRVVTLDAAHAGRVVGDLKTRASGVDIIDYDPARHHLYVPGGKSASMSTVAVAADGSLMELGSSPSPPSGHCAVTDRQGHAYVCDPPGGRLVVFEDPHPITPWP